jgi:hypothetical protein
MTLAQALLGAGIFYAGFMVGVLVMALLSMSKTVSGEVDSFLSFDEPQRFDGGFR